MVAVSGFQLKAEPYTFAWAMGHVLSYDEFFRLTRRRVGAQEKETKENRVRKATGMVIH